MTQHLFIMLKLTPKMSGTRKDGSTYFAYNVVGNATEVENYIRVESTKENYPRTVESIIGEDGNPTHFENRPIHSSNAELFLGKKGAFTRNPIRKALGSLAKQIESAEANGSSTRILEKEENILIAQNMEQKAQAIAEMDKAMSDFRNNSTQEEVVAPKTKSKAKAKAVASDDEEDLV